MSSASDSGPASAWGISGASGPLPVAGGETGAAGDQREINPGPVRLRYHRGYWIVLIAAWVVYLISMLLPTMYIDPPCNYGWEAFWLAGYGCVIPVEPLIFIACWVGTLSNAVMLILTPIFRAGGKRPGAERFFNGVALISGIWVWGILLVFGFGFFGIGYYVWSLTHVAVGTRMFWKRIYFDRLGELPPGVRTRGAKPILATRAPDDWPKDQAGNWDEGR